MRGGNTDEERAKLNTYLKKMERSLRALFGSNYAKVMQIKSLREAINDGTPFTWKEHPTAQAQAEQMLKDLGSKAFLMMANGVTFSYKLGGGKAEKHILSGYTGTAQEKQAAAIIEAASRQRKREGLTAAAYVKKNFRLSGRVWNLTDQSLKELEIIIQNGIKEGKGADAMAAEAQKYLNEPNRLFRRVRNKETGDFELSKAAQNYHPGRGVYRSAFKNAMRLARTEVNNAYRAAEWLSYQSNPLVKSYRISLSGNHTTTTTSGKIETLFDICDKLQGEYPKSFKWQGWHPQCRCIMTPVTLSPAEFSEYLRSRHEAEGRMIEAPAPAVKIPNKFKEWIRQNAERINEAEDRQTAPNWVNDNATLIHALQVVNTAKEDYKRLSGNKDYENISYNAQSGGMMATHKAHNFDKHKGWYEKKVQEVGCKNGHSVILEREDQAKPFERSTEGTWDGKKFEIAAAETGTINNILRALKHCKGKRAEIAVIFFPNDNYNSVNFKAAVAKYKGLKGTSQYKDFDVIYCLTPSQIVGIEKAAHV